MACRGARPCAPTKGRQCLLPSSQVSRLVRCRVPIRALRLCGRRAPLRDQKPWTAWSANSGPYGAAEPHCATGPDRRRGPQIADPTALQSPIAQPEPWTTWSANSGPYRAAEPHGATGNHRRCGPQIADPTALRGPGAALRDQKPWTTWSANSGPYGAKEPHCATRAMDDVVRWKRTLRGHVVRCLFAKMNDGPLESDPTRP